MPSSANVSKDSLCLLRQTDPTPRLENERSDRESVDIASAAPCPAGEVTREDGKDESQLHRGDLVIG